MVKLEQFLLSELKDIFNYVRNKYKILLNYKIYQLNKFDIIIIMRNSNYFIEDDPNDLIFKYKKKIISFYPSLSRRFFRGQKIKEGLIMSNEPITLYFD